MSRRIAFSLVVVLVLAGCGGKATPDSGDVARAVEATLTARARVPTLNIPAPTAPGLDAVSKLTDTPERESVIITATPTAGAPTQLLGPTANVGGIVEVAYPAQWESAVGRDASENYVNAYFRPESASDTECPCFMLWWFPDEDSGFPEARLPWMAEGFDIILSGEPVPWSGTTDWFRSEFEGPFGDFPESMQGWLAATYWEFGGFLFALAASPADEWKDYEYTMEAILSSVAFIDPHSTAENVARVWVEVVDAGACDLLASLMSPDQRDGINQFCGENATRPCLLYQHIEDAVVRPDPQRLYPEAHRVTLIGQFSTQVGIMMSASETCGQLRRQGRRGTERSKWDIVVEPIGAKWYVVGPTLAGVLMD